MKIITICASPNLASYQPHKHQWWELLINVSGAGYCYYDMQLETFEPGSIFCFPPGIVHSKKATTEFFQDLYVVFDDCYLVHTLAQHTFHDDSFHTVEKLLHLMMNLYYLDQSGNAAICNCLLEAILRILNTQRTQTMDSVDRAAYALQSELIQNFSNPEFSMRDFTTVSNYSQDYIVRRFRTRFGCTPLAYLTKLRIQCAKALLEQYADTANISISEIGFQSGFYDASYFSRVFKQHVGCTPLAFRRQHSGAACASFSSE